MRLILCSTFCRSATSDTHLYRSPAIGLDQLNGVPQIIERAPDNSYRSARRGQSLREDPTNAAPAACNQGNLAS
jgi:hypothetical protein